MYRIGKYMQVAWISIKENWSRTFLTMLGIIIGVGAVILMTSLGKGAEGYILGSVATFGPDIIYIVPGGEDQSLTGAFTAPDAIKYNDFKRLSRVDFLKDVTPFMAYDAIVAYESENQKTQVIGVNKNYPSAFNFNVGKGRFIDENDFNSRLRVVVVGIEMAEKLFGFQDPIGRTMKIQNTNFKVVGVMEVQGGNAFEDYDNMVFIPTTTMQTYIFGVDYVQAIAARVVGDMDDGIELTKRYMRNLHRIDDPADDDFTVISQVQTVEIFGTVTDVLTYFIVAIASISLVVGGVGIMNIMYVSVNQRTREIGLRKAVGATNRDVLFQFLLEAAVISFLGGIIGIVAGLVMAFAIYLVMLNLIDGWIYGINWYAVLISSIVPIFIGIFFGYYPARRAAKQDPINALRYE